MSTEKVTNQIGKGKPGPGRPKGIPNKATQEAREVIKRIIDGKAADAEQWLESVADGDPYRALQCYIALLEFGVPKLARTELTGKDGGPIETRPLMIVPDDGRD